MHKPPDELKAELLKAREAVSIGRLYYHYKDLTSLYKVLRIAITESDDSPCVIYQAQYDPDLVFVRPLSNWLGKVELGNKSVSRFTLVK